MAMTNTTLAPSVEIDGATRVVDTAVGVTITSPSDGAILGATFPISGTVGVDPIPAKATVTVLLDNLKLAEIPVDIPEGEAVWNTTATIDASIVNGAHTIWASAKS